MNHRFLLSLPKYVPKTRPRGSAEGTTRKTHVVMPDLSRHPGNCKLRAANCAEPWAPAQGPGDALCGVNEALQTGWIEPQPSITFTIVTCAASHAASSASSNSSVTR